MTFWPAESLGRPTVPIGAALRGAPGCVPSAGDVRRAQCRAQQRIRDGVGRVPTRQTIDCLCADTRGVRGNTGTVTTCRRCGVLRQPSPSLAQWLPHNVSVPPGQPLMPQHCGRCDASSRSGGGTRCPSSSSSSSVWTPTSAPRTPVMPPSYVGGTELTLYANTLPYMFLPQNYDSEHFLRLQM